MQLIEDAIDGSWIGHRARTAILGDSAIGSVYSPPKDSSPIANRRHLSASPPPRHHVETVIDIGYREQGWLLKFEKSGIRRVLMNLFGNSLKFTTDGYVHVTARSLPNGANDDPKKVRVELSVEDTGKVSARDVIVVPCIAWLGVSNIDRGFLLILRESIGPSRRTSYFTPSLRKILYRRGRVLGLRSLVASSSRRA